MNSDRSHLPAIDYVSPLPPVRSGISDYSVDLIPALAEHCRLRLVRLPGAEPTAAIRELVPSAAWTCLDGLGEEGRLPLYHMGNNHHHLDIWRAAMERPGVLVLHDLVLHHFLLEQTVKFGDFDAYRETLAANHGWIGDWVGRPIRWPGAVGSSAQFALPAHRELLIRQKGVLTHSPWAEELLREEVPGLRVRSLAMGVPLPAAANRQAGEDFKRRYGLPLDRPIIGSFGFQTPIKRTVVAVEALAHPGLEQVHLMVAGEVSEIVGLEQVAARVGVSDRVHVLGFLPFDDFEAGIAAVDVALNLRYPTAGETSASLLRILAVGRPALVSDYAQSADLPDSVVIKVPLGGDEPRRLADKLSALLVDTEGLSSMGRRARDYVAQHHRPVDAASAMAEACAQWAELAPPSLTAPDPPPAGSLIGAPLSGTLDVLGTEAPWAPGERRTLTVVLRNESQFMWSAGERFHGGIALEPQLWVKRGSEARDLFAGRPWPGLPRDLEPGQEHAFNLTFRRPLDSNVELRLIPHALGRTSFSNLGGPVWQGEI